MDARVFTPHELAERWQTTVKAVESMMRHGEIRAFKVGRYWRVAESAVAEHEAQVAS